MHTRTCARGVGADRGGDAAHASDVPVFSARGASTGAMAHGGEGRGPEGGDGGLPTARHGIPLVFFKNHASRKCKASASLLRVLSRAAWPAKHQNVQLRPMHTPNTGHLHVENTAPQSELDGGGLASHACRGRTHNRALMCGEANAAAVATSNPRHRQQSTNKVSGNLIQRSRGRCQSPPVLKPPSSAWSYTTTRPSALTRRPPEWRGAAPSLGWARRASYRYVAA